VTRSKAILFALALAIAAMVCVVPLGASGQQGGAAAPATGTAVKGGDAVYGTWQAPDTLDVQVTGLQIVWSIACQMFDSMLTKKPGAVEFSPGLAEKWESNADSTEFTFYLRKGVKFHDGTPFNAQAVKFSWDRLADPATRSAGARSALGDYKETVVVDDYTVKVRFNAPWAGFLNMCTAQGLSPHSPTAIKKWGDQYQFHVTGTGPFMLKEYVPDDHVTMVRNPDYNWGAPWVASGPAALDSVTYKFIPEDLTRVSTLKTGETNLVDNIRSHDIAEIQKNPKLKTKVTPLSGGPWILNLNVVKAPTSDINVRKAVAYSIDRDAIVKLLYVGTNEPSYQPLEKNTVGYDPALDKILKYDPAMAKKLLDDAGWKVGSDGIRVKDGQRLKLIWVIWTGGGMEEPAAVCQDQMRQVGIEAVIETYDVGTAFGKWNDKNALNIAMPFCVSVDPNYMQAWYGSMGLGSQNWQHLSSPELDRLLGECEKSADPKVRSAAYAKVSKWLLENAVVVPLFGKSLPMAMKKNLEGITYDTTGYPMFYGAHFTK